jgi:hypothetical protein
MHITPAQGSDWRQWLLVTSIPLVHLDDTGKVVGLGSGTLIDHEGRRYIVAAEHVVKRESAGWAIVVQQDADGRMEYYKPNAFIYLGEFRRSTAAFRIMDLCAAQVPADLETWYEYRTPRGLFDKRPHHVFDSRTMAAPEADQIYGFSGQVRTEQHGAQTFASEMVVYPGLSYASTEQEEHHFVLPVPHPGHEAFHGCSGSPVVDFSRRLVATLVGGSTAANTVRGVAIQWVLPALALVTADNGV